MAVSSYALPMVHGPANSLKPHSAIFISSNSGFNQTNGVTSGNGTISNPYVIEGWEINQTTTTGQTGIVVANTTAYFVIKNVYVRDLVNGIDFASVVHSTIDNVNVANTTDGIYLLSSSQGVIRDSNVMNDQNGIQLYQSSLEGCFNNTVSYATSYGIATADLSYNITIEGNAISFNRYGLSLSSTTNLVVSRNRFFADTTGIAMNGDTNTWLTENSLVGGSEYLDLTASSITHVFHNNFLDPNYYGVTITTSYSDSWDNGYPSGGNFWDRSVQQDNCTGPKQDVCTSSDGIEDFPFYVYGLELDHYPLMRPFGPPPHQAPVWPPGSQVNATNNQLYSLILEWTPVVGASRYHVVDSSGIVADTIATSSTIYKLIPGTTYTFKVEALDAWGNFTTGGPSLTLRPIPQGAYLQYNALYVGAPYQGGTTVIVNNFTDLGTTTIRVTSLTLSGDIGTFYLNSLPVTLLSGEDRILNMTINIPSGASVGNRTVQVVVDWQSMELNGTWINGPPIVATGRIPVLAGPNPTTGPQNPKNPPSVSKTSSPRQINLYGIAAFLIIPGLALYLTLVVVAGILLFSRTRRHSARPKGGFCTNCGTLATPGGQYCGTCGTRLSDPLGS